MRKARVIMVTAGVCGLIAATGGATAALASIPSANGVIHGCYSSTGALRVVNATTCPAGQKTLSWNQKGAAGAPGPAGFYTWAKDSAVTTLAPGQTKAAIATCPILSGVQGLAMGGGAITYLNNGQNLGPAPDLRMIDSAPWHDPGGGSQAPNYNTGWYASETNTGNGTGEAFVTWATCIYPGSFAG